MTVITDVLPRRHRPYICFVYAAPATNLNLTVLKKKPLKVYFFKLKMEKQVDESNGVCIKISFYNIKDIIKMYLYKNTMWSVSG